MSLLKVDQLSIEFETLRGKLRAVDRLSFEVAEGESLGIVGESGCGKSITSLAIMGLLPASAKTPGSRIVFQGRDLTAEGEAAWRGLRGRDVAMIFQDPMSALNPAFQIGFQIFECLPTTMDRRARALELLHHVGIRGAEDVLKAYPHQLSGGMCQRVMIAMALAGEPKLLIADEPTTALDVTIQAQILKLIRDIRGERKMALILITHDIGVVRAMTDRTLVMYAGQAVEVGPTREVVANPAHPYTEGLLKSLPSRQRGLPKRTRLPTLAGWVPDLTKRPSGCQLHPRCPYAQTACTERDPELVKASANRLSRCLFEGPSRTARTAPLLSETEVAP